MTTTTTTTTNMKIKLPVVKVTPVNEAAEILVEAVEAGDTHNHAEDSGVKITPEGININTDLDVNSYSLLDVNSVELVAQSSDPLSGASNTLRFSAYAKELYFTDGDGVAVKITSNGSLDTTTSGGWAGDYSSTTAEANYSDSTKTFQLLQDAPNNQAGKLDVADIKLRTTTAGDTTYLTIASPVVASSWTLTLPDSPPGNTRLLTMDSSGTVDYTLTPSVTSISTGTVSATGSISSDSVSTGTVSATGLISANGGVTAGSGDDITVQGSGEFKHGEMTLPLPAQLLEIDSASTSGDLGSDGSVSGKFSTGQGAHLGIVLSAGCRIKDVDVYITDTLSTSISVQLKGEVLSSASFYQSSTVTSAQDASRQTLSISSVNRTIEATGVYWINISSSNAIDNVTVHGAVVTYDRP